jgi:hypothetical protein
MFNRQSLRYKINIAIFLTRGGEEFLVLLPQQDLAQAAMPAENLRATIETTTVAEINKVTSSFGVTGYMTEDTVESLVKRADFALYRAKDLEEVFSPFFSTKFTGRGLGFPWFWDLYRHTAVSLRQRAGSVKGVYSGSFSRCPRKKLSSNRQRKPRLRKFKRLAPSCW